MKILLVGASGYVGARLAHDIQGLGHTLKGCDTTAPSDPDIFAAFHRGTYQTLPTAFFEGTDAVLWFAGHSTVKKAHEDPWGCFTNNVDGLLQLARTAHERRIPLIYASSASLYSSANDTFMLTATEERSNPYDASKLAFDIMLNALGYRAVGLRMATVAGWSPVMRWDTVFNSMNRSSKTQGNVNVTNPSNFRGLLYIDDLSTCVVSLLGTITDGSFLAGPQQIPLSSWSGSIGTMASEIAAFWGVPVNFGADEGTYSFVVTDRSLRRHCVDSKTVYQSIGDRCAAFCSQIGWASPALKGKNHE